MQCKERRWGLIQWWWGWTILLENEIPITEKQHLIIPIYHTCPLNIYIYMYRELYEINNYYSFIPVQMLGGWHLSFHINNQCVLELGHSIQFNSFVRPSNLKSFYCFFDSYVFHGIQFDAVDVIIHSETECWMKE